MIPTSARNAGFAEMITMLRVQHDAKNDAVVPATKMFSCAQWCADRGFTFQIEGMGLDGPAEHGNAGQFMTTEVFDEHLADKLSIPLPYLRRLRSERPGLLDANINSLLHGDETDQVLPDARKFFVRTFMDPEGGPGVVRGMLSDTYRPIDNLDVVNAALAGVLASGAIAEVDLPGVVEKGQISERRMSLDIVCPQIAVSAKELLREYRDPFEGGAQRAGGWTIERARAAAAREGSGYAPGEEPMLFAGFQLSNSELGGGAFMLCPRIVFSPCSNGLKLSGEMRRRVHLGARMEEGQINWSEATHKANLELITSMTADAVAAWLSTDYLAEKVSYMLEEDEPLHVPAVEAVQLVSATLNFTKSQQDGILEHFIRGGQLSSLGLINAITSFAQTVESSDESYDLESRAFETFAIL